MPKLYITREIIIEVEVEQNPEPHTNPDDPIDPSECRLWFPDGATTALTIDPQRVKVVEDEKTRTHNVTNARVVGEIRVGGASGVERGLYDDLRQAVERDRPMGNMFVDTLKEFHQTIGPAEIIPFPTGRD